MGEWEGTRGVWGAYPKVCGPSIKVKVEGFAWGANSNGAEVFRVILLVLGGHTADLTASELLLEDGLHGSFASDELLLAMFTLLVHVAAHEVGTFHCGPEGILVEEVDVGLWAGAFILGVVDELDAVEASGCHNC